MTTSVDSALARLGSPGRFHLMVYICLGANNIIVVLNHLAMVVFAPKTEHECAVSDALLNQTTGTSNSSQWVTADKCALHVNETVDAGGYEWRTNDLKCPGEWNYPTQHQEFNIIMQYDLVCDRKYLIHLATTIYFCGVMLGGLVFGTLSDMFGRKPFLLLTLYAQIGIGVWTAFTNHFVIFIFLRFVQGFLMQGLQTTSLVLIMELFPRAYSTMAGSMFEVFWALGVMWLALLGYSLQNWRYIQLAIVIPNVLTVFYIWFIPESIRWLMTHNKVKEANRVLQHMAKINGVSVAQNLLEESPSTDGDKEQKSLADPSDSDSSNSSQQGAASTAKHNVLDLFKFPELRKRSLVLFYIWFVVTATYYGISLRLSSFAGNKYLNFFYGGLCELPVYSVAYFIVNKFGRKRPLVLYLFVGGVTGVTAGVTSQLFVDIAPTQLWIPTVMAVLSRMSMAGCFSIIWLYASELYPTVIRNVSVGSCTFWMRVGALLAPQILHLGDLTYGYIPIIVFGALCVIGGCVTLLLPETKGIKLPETILDVEVTRGHVADQERTDRASGMPPQDGVELGKLAASENGYISVSGSDDLPKGMAL